MGDEHSGRDPFYGPAGRRAIRPEIESYIAETAGCTVVYGLAEVIDAGDARVGAGHAGTRISGFMERHDYREWLLPLTASKGLAWKTAPVSGTSRAKVAFLLSIGFGNGSPLPQPSGRWDLYVNDRFALSMRVVNHDQVWQDGPCTLAFAANRIETAAPYASLTLSALIANESMAAFGPAFLVVPASWVQAGSPAVIRVEGRGQHLSTRWFQLEAAPSILDGADIYRALGLLTDARRPRFGEERVYFGDIHTHSGQVLDRCDDSGCGMGTREENYEYARGAGGLDFYALTDHEWQVDPDRIEEYLLLADAFDEPGRFVCLPGYEHTSLLYGHRNVYFRGPGGTVVNANRDWRGAQGGRPTKDPAKALTPAELWSALERTEVPFITVPHHPSATSHPLTWAYFHPPHDRLVEVYSVWGSSEYYGDHPRGVSDRLPTSDVRDALRRGLRFGLIASADGHDGHPGNAQSPLVKHHHQFHFCGSGRAAVLTQELTREAIFDALYRRRCYATSGPPIALSVDLNETAMGEEIPSLLRGDRPQLAVRCQGTNGIDHLRVVKNGQVVHTAPCHGERACELAWEDPAYDPETANSYYVRVVQVDRESAWSSPIWVG